MSQLLSSAFSLLLLLWLAPANLAADASPQPARLAIWNGRAPLGDGRFEQAETWITVHHPAKPNGTAVVICPGGGYGGLVTGAEGHGIAKWLNQQGVVGVVLEYRLPAGRPRVPLLDAQRALRMVRLRAPNWQVNPARIGIMGFSAGGHLAATAGTQFDAGDPRAADPVERCSSRPDFMVLVYPVITMGADTHQGSRDNLLGKDADRALIAAYSAELQVTPRTPPCFLAHAQDDKPVPPVHSQKFFEALRAQQVPARYLQLPSGGHGLNGYRGPMWDAWQAQSLAWLRGQKLME
jgi:acetyl esterase/lipase